MGYFVSSFKEHPPGALFSFTNIDGKACSVKKLLSNQCQKIADSRESVFQSLVALP